MSQKKLADEAGLSLGSIQGYEQGRYAPKHDSLKKIASALGVTLADLAPERYPVAFDTPKGYERGWIETGGAPHPGRVSDLARIEINEDKLNDDGVKRLADYSDDLVSSGKYDL